MPYPESSIAKPTPTILSHLHTLLQSHQLAHPHLSLPYLHPYAPSSSASWKGKAREIPLNPSAQLDILRQLRETVEAAKGLLVKTGGKEEERERVKLARALKEVYALQFPLPLVGSLILFQRYPSVIPPPSDLIPFLPSRSSGQTSPAPNSARPPPTD